METDSILSGTYSSGRNVCSMPHWDQERRMIGELSVATREGLKIDERRFVSRYGHEGDPARAPVDSHGGKAEQGIISVDPAAAGRGVPGDSQPCEGIAPDQRVPFAPITAPSGVSSLISGDGPSSVAVDV